MKPPCGECETVGTASVLKFRSLQKYGANLKLPRLGGYFFVSVLKKIFFSFRRYAPFRAQKKRAQRASLQALPYGVGLSYEKNNENYKSYLQNNPFPSTSQKHTPRGGEIFHDWRRDFPRLAVENFSFH